jgi:hypothetical protein
MKKITYQQCIGLLEQNVLLNIILLKHASSLKDTAQYFQINSLIGISFKPKQMQHDRVLYPDYDTISILSNTNDIDTYLETLTPGAHILKVNGFLPNKSFNILQSFKSLTTQNKVIIKYSNEIHHEINIKTNHYKYLFGLINYSIDDIHNMIVNNAAYVLSIKDNDVPVCSCMVYQVLNNIWEIGALSTAEDHRRQHLAESLVSYATNDLLLQKRIPRYHVNINNQASYHLALKCGYEPFIHFNHYSYRKT